ncbi:MAG: DUF924 family protein [Elusimicrobiota bacterium]
MADIEEVLRFWFGEDKSRPLENRGKWWKKDPAFDEDIRRRFGALTAQALNGELAGWKADPHGALALILLLDQFPRNIHRGKPEAFMGDETALDTLLRGLAEGSDYRLTLIERCFFYLPLMHSEDLERQKQSLQKFGVIAEAAPPEQKAYFEGTLEFAQRHHDIVAEFGRFPHRNTILGRASSPVEVEFLKRPGSSF